LLGHSLGGLYIRNFQQRYPSETRALIFLDAVTPGAYEGTSGAALGLDETSVEERSGFRFLDWAREVTGYARLLHQCSDVPAPLATIHRLYEADQCIASQDAEQRKEGQAIKADLQELSSQPINIPVLVLSEDKSPTFQTKEAISQWNRLQAGLLNLSPQSYRVIASNSDHFLQIDCPDFVTEEIRHFLEFHGAYLRRYGTTTKSTCK
jgi:pimeloyl-ACP methyl ester carboxylesterase